MFVSTPFDFYFELLEKTQANFDCCNLELFRYSKRNKFLKQPN